MTVIYKTQLHLGEVLEVLETKGINVELLKGTEGFATINPQFGLGKGEQTLVVGSFQKGV